MKRAGLMLLALLVPAVSAFAAHPAPADLDAIKAIPEWSKRSDFALDHASLTLDRAKADNKTGDMTKVQADLDEIDASAKVCFSALQDSGKKPRNDKHYKHAELKLRELARHLMSFREDVPFERQDAVTVVLKNVQDIHDRLLLEIMGKGR